MKKFDVTKWKINKYLLLQLLILFNAAAFVMQKALAISLSISWVSAVLFFLIQICFAVYAFGWQQILKLMPLNVAVANTASTYGWGMLFGFILFGERIRPFMFIGVLVIIVGIRMVTLDND